MGFLLVNCKQSISLHICYTICLLPSLATPLSFFYSLLILLLSFLWNSTRLCTKFPISFFINGLISYLACPCLLNFCHAAPRAQRRQRLMSCLCIYFLKTQVPALSEGSVDPKKREKVSLQSAWCASKWLIDTRLLIS